MILGIDASNIRGGGGVTHLVELLAFSDPAAAGFERAGAFFRSYRPKLLDRRTTPHCNTCTHFLSSGRDRKLQR